MIYTIKINLYRKKNKILLINVIYVCIFNSNIHKKTTVVTQKINYFYLVNLALHFVFFIISEHLLKLPLSTILNINNFFLIFCMIFIHFSSKIFPNILVSVLKFKLEIDKII